MWTSSLTPRIIPQFLSRSSQNEVIETTHGRPKGSRNLINTLVIFPSELFPLFVPLISSLCDIIQWMYGVCTSTPGAVTTQGKNIESEQGMISLSARKKLNVLLLAFRAKGNQNHIWMKPINPHVWSHIARDRQTVTWIYPEVIGKSKFQEWIFCSFGKRCTGFAKCLNFQNTCDWNFVDNRKARGRNEQDLQLWWRLQFMFIPWLVISAYCRNKIPCFKEGEEFNCSKANFPELAPELKTNITPPPKYPSGCRQATDFKDQDRTPLQYSWSLWRQPLWNIFYAWHKKQEATMSSNTQPKTAVFLSRLLRQFQCAMTDCDAWSHEMQQRQVEKEQRNSQSFAKKRYSEVSGWTFLAEDLLVLLLRETMHETVVCYCEVFQTENICVCLYRWVPLNSKQKYRVKFLQINWIMN